MNHVAVLRDGATLANKPELKVYTNYNHRHNPVPVVFINPDVNVYQGSNGILYRVFAKDTQGTQGLHCMDILMPLKVDGAAKSGISAKSGKVIYGLPNNLQVADFIPKMAK